MSDFKKYKFNSTDEYEILQAVELFKELGYSQYIDVFDIALAVEFNGVCTWGDGKITEGYLVSNTHEDVTLEELKVIMCEAIYPSFEVSSLNGEESENKAYDIFVKILNKDWKKLDSYPVETYFSSQYKHLIGVQFNKNIYSFRDNHYVHNIIRDKDGDICVVDQYGVDYKLRYVEFYVSDEHDDTMTYQQYSKFVSI